MKTKLQARILAVIIFFALLFIAAGALGFTTQPPTALGPSILFITILIYRRVLKPEAGFYKWRKNHSKKKTKSNSFERIDNSKHNQLSINLSQPNYFARKVILNLLIIILILTNLLWVFAEPKDLAFLRIFSYFLWSFTLLCIVLRLRLRGSNRVKKKSSSPKNDKSDGILIGVADELTKLNQLKKDGVLTYEEFELQKNKLLS